MDAAATRRETRHDRRPLGSRFQDTCRQTRSGGGLPEGSIIPAGITHDLVLQFDLPARKAEREERLLAFHSGNLNATLLEICREGGGKDAHFLLAHGADAHLSYGYWAALIIAASCGHLGVVEALLDAGADRLDDSLWWSAREGHTAIVALLLDRGADVHYANENALYWAAVLGHLGTAAVLLQRGATVRNEFLADAVRRGNHAIADLLRAHMA